MGNGDGGHERNGAADCWSRVLAGAFLCGASVTAPAKLRWPPRNPSTRTGLAVTDFGIGPGVPTRLELAFALALMRARGDPADIGSIQSERLSVRSHSRQLLTSGAGMSKLRNLAAAVLAVAIISPGQAAGP